VGERERHGIGWRSVRLGVVRAVVVGVVVFAGLSVVRYACAPVVRDLAGGVSLPDLRSIALFSAVLGVLVGLQRMRATRRVRSSHADPNSIPGARALVIARGNRVAERSARAAVALPVQRWSADLLDGGDLVSVAEVVGIRDGA